MRTKIINTLISFVFLSIIAFSFMYSYLRKFNALPVILILLALASCKKEVPVKNNETFTTIARPARVIDTLTHK